MIYAKIYLDTDTANRPILVIETAGKESLYLSFAKEIYDKSGRLRYTETHTTVSYAGNIAVSPEAKAFFLSRLSDNKTHTAVSDQACDFKFIGSERTSYGDFSAGYVAFLPDRDAHYPRRRTLTEGERFTVCTDQQPLREIFDTMQTADNEFLKTLDLSEPLTAL